MNALMDTLTGEEKARLYNIIREVKKSKGIVVRVPDVLKEFPLLGAELLIEDACLRVGNDPTFDDYPKTQGVPLQTSGISSRPRKSGTGPSQF